MLKHVVMWTLKEEKKDKIDEMVNSLSALRSKVSVIRNLSVGRDINRGNFSYDIALVVKVDDLEALETYRTHPEHLKVAEFIKKLVDKRAVVDFEE